MKHSSAVIRQLNIAHMGQGGMKKPAGSDAQLPFPAAMVKNADFKAKCRWLRNAHLHRPLNLSMAKAGSASAY